MQWYLKVLSNYAIFSGRARRKEYWMFYLFNYLIMVLIFLMPIGITSMTTSGICLPGLEFGYAGILLYMAVLFVPNLAVTVRRLHDINKSGWWILMPLTPVGIIVLLETVMGSNPLLTEITPFVSLIPSIYFIFLMAKEGTVGENRFGPDSIERSDTDTKDSV